MPKKQTPKRVKAGTSKAAAADRRAKFVEAYLTNGGNATQAAVTAGYSEKRARATGAELVADRNIRSEIDRRKAEVIEKAQEKTQLTADELLRSVARDVRFDPAKLFNEDKSVKHITEMDEDTRLALRGIDVEELWSGRGEERAAAGTVTKFKLPEKTSAREQGMKHFNLYKDDAGNKGPTVVVVMGLDAKL